MIPINFEWYPAAQAPVGTIVAVEGGPGYASTGSRDSYIELFGGLQHPQPAAGRQPRHRHLGLIYCRPLQHWHLSPSATRRTTGAWPPAATSSNTARPLPGGGFAHGSDLYGTANAARDLADGSPPSRPGRSTCTATPTAATSARPSPPATRGCCGP